MNRLKPLIRIYILSKTGVWLQPTHLSLYLALFWSWQTNGYNEYFTVYRKDLMFLEKIKSVATYHKCMKDLSALGHIEYRRSYNYYKGSQVKFITEMTTVGRYIEA